MLEVFVNTRCAFSVAFSQKQDITSLMFLQSTLAADTKDIKNGRHLQYVVFAFN